MPAVTTTGVSATASKPSSTLKRMISNTLATVKKLGATAEKSATSAASAAASTHRPFAGG